MKNSNITNPKSFLLLLLAGLPGLALAQPLSLEVQATPPTCYGYTDGSAQALPTGGTAPYSYSWSNNQNGQTASGLAAGSYSVTVSDAVGATASDTAMVEEAEPLSISLLSAPFACESDTLQVTAVFDPADSLSFDWQSGSPNLVLLENGLPTANFTANDTGTYSLILTMSTPIGCTATDTLTATFLPEHVAVDPELFDYRQCEGLTVEFDNLNPGVSDAFAWYFNWPDTTAFSTLPNPSYTYPDSGNFIVALIPMLPCLQDTFYLSIYIDAPPIAQFFMEKGPCSDTVLVHCTDISLVPGGVMAWHWTFSNGSSSSEQHPTVAVTQTQYLTATLTVSFDNGCTMSVTDSLDVFVFNQGFPDGLLALCPGMASVELNPDGDSTYTYAWSPPTGLSSTSDWNPTATLSSGLTYGVTISDDSSGELCVADMMVTVVLPPALGLQAPPDVLVCEANPDTLLAIVALGEAQFWWSSQADFGDTLSLDASLAVTPGSPPTLYFLEVSDAYGCSARDSVLVGNFAVQAQLDVFQKVCINSPPSVEVAGLLPGDELVWQPFDPNSQVLTDTATFTATVINPQGCSIVRSIFLSPVDMNSLFFVEPDLDTIVQGQSTQLQVVSELQHICTWTPAESLDEADDCTVVASPTEPTTYIVTVEDPATGCKGTDTAFVCVISNLCDEPMIFVPNVFSPNGDGLNDVLYIRGFNVGEILSFEIFNRWGERVFETNNPAQGWDGTVQGKEVSGDVFAYFLRVRCKVGEEFFTKGNITVLK